MRTRLLLLTAVTVILAALAGRQEARAGAAACTATGSGHHTRSQLLAVHLSAGCPSTGSGTGRLRFAQYPGLRGRTAFTIDYAAATIALRLPATLEKNPPAQWIFWPSGACEPANVRFKGSDGSWEVNYAPLTARPEIVRYATK
jgi:hypothetical protein